MVFRWNPLAITAEAACRSPKAAGVWSAHPHMFSQLSPLARVKAGPIPSAKTCRRVWHPLGVVRCLHRTNWSRDRANSNRTTEPSSSSELWIGTQTGRKHTRRHCKHKIERAREPGVFTLELRVRKFGVKIRAVCGYPAQPGR